MITRGPGLNNLQLCTSFTDKECNSTSGNKLKIVKVP